MEIQEMVDKLCEGEMYKRVATGQNMSLGQLISVLEAVSDPRLRIECEDGRGVGDIDSYRGYYSDLAIKPDEDMAFTTVSGLLCRLQMAVGEVFVGYKGGDFKMELHTPVWVSEYGEASGLAVKGVEVRDDKVVILTKQIY